MNKILKVLILILVLNITRIKGVMAETFYEDNWIDGVYANLVDGDFSKPQQMRFIKRKSDNMPVYCLTPRDTIYETEEYSRYNAGNLDILNMDVEKYLRLSEIAYFGYGYPNHTSDKWYAITQFMLWREMEPTMDIFFTDKFKGNRINKFEDEINEIESLINEFKKIPDFGILNLLPNTNYHISDKNNTLNTYDLYNSEGIEVRKENNNIIIKTKNIGEHFFDLFKTPKLYSETSYIYKANNGQDLLLTGTISNIHVRYNVSVNKSILNINKKNLETHENISGAIYGLYDDNKKLIRTLTTDNNGNCSFDNLVYGSYFIKEITPPIGYKLDYTMHDIDINKEEVNINLYDEKIKSKITIIKKLNDTLDYEENIKFNIYDKNNNFIKEIITDEYGKAVITLDYGKYKVVQQNTTLGYKKVNDFYINVENEDDQTINLEDERIIVNLKVLKKDIESKKSIMNSNTKFKIYDLINEEYINNNEIFETTNGEFNTTLKGGKYLLEEIKSPNGYILSENKEFIIDNNTNIIDNTYELDFYNEKQYGILNINKLGKSLNGKNIPLPNVKFGLYAYEDIITDDNIVHYKKDELVDELITDKNGEVISNNLFIGKYYVKELNTLDNYVIDDNKYIIDFNNSSDLKIIYKSISITNNEKEKYYCKYINNKYYDKLGNIVDKDKFIKSCNVEEIKKFIEKNDISKQNEKHNNKTIFPKTSNTEILINTIISYMLFIGIILLIKNIKHEK